MGQWQNDYRQLDEANAGRLLLRVCYGLTLAARYTNPIDFARQGTIEEKVTLDLSSDNDAEIVVEYTNTPPPNTDDGTSGNAQPGLMRGVVCGALISVKMPG